MSNNLASSDPLQGVPLPIGTNPFVPQQSQNIDQRLPSSGQNPSPINAPLVDLGLDSQQTGAAAASIDIDSEILIPGVHPTSPSGRGQSITGTTTTGMDNFGSAAVDIDMLEKQIAAKEESNRESRFVDLTGEIRGSTPSGRTRSSAVEPDLETDFDTLDEPVWDTIRRDLRAVGAKFGQVLVPRNNQQLLRDWDLWGPLFICVFISLLLQSGDGGKGPRFTEVFSLTFFGSVVVTLNIKLLGGHISFFQSLCVLGYCLLPPAAAAFLCMLVDVREPGAMIFFIRLLVTGIGFVWATYASMAFLSGSQPEKRKFLAVYPIFLFYFVVSWMVLTHSSF